MPTAQSLQVKREAIEQLAHWVHERASPEAAGLALLLRDALRGFTVENVDSAVEAEELRVRLARAEMELQAAQGEIQRGRSESADLVNRIAELQGEAALHMVRDDTALQAELGMLQEERSRERAALDLARKALQEAGPKQEELEKALEAERKRAAILFTENEQLREARIAADVAHEKAVRHGHELNLQVESALASFSQFKTRWAQARQIVQDQLYAVEWSSYDKDVTFNNGSKIPTCYICGGWNPDKVKSADSRKGHRKDCTRIKWLQVVRDAMKMLDA